MNPKKIHFVFAGGAAVSAVCALAKKTGFDVSACEHLNPKSPFFLELKNLGIPIYEESGPSHLEGVDLLVISNATKKLDPENLELRQAERSGLPIMLAEEFLNEFLLKDKFVLAVSGTNGKSTTTAMLGLILEEAGLDPSVFVGAVVPEWKVNYRFGKSKYFVIEADEYSEKFLLYRPNVEIITNIDFDHPDYFPSLEAVQEAFEKFVQNIQENGSIFLGQNVSLNSKRENQKPFSKQNFDLKIPGNFNQENASLAYSAALSLGVAEQTARNALENFNGVSRRFEFKGEKKGIKIFDDYAHHPAGISVTLKAAREKFPNEKIWCVFQPHTYSRLEKLFKEFVKAFDEASIDKLILLPVYGSREQGGKIDSSDLAKEIKTKDVITLESNKQAALYITENASTGAVVLVMGAGDVNEVSELILKEGNKV